MGRLHRRGQINPVEVVSFTMSQLALDPMVAPKDKAGLAESGKKAKYDYETFNPIGPNLRSDAGLSGCTMAAGYWCRVCTVRRSNKLMREMQ